MSTELTLLVAVENAETLEVVKKNVERYGYKIIYTVNSEDTLLYLQNSKTDIIIIDFELPGMSVTEVLKTLRDKHATKNTPVIVLIHKDINPSDFIQVSKMADDYILKPFAPTDLIVCIKSASRKVLPLYGAKTLEFEDIKMEVDSFKVSRGGLAVQLGPTEFRILQCFLEFPKKVLSRDYLIRYVWGYNSKVEPRTIDVHINRLRNALRSHNDDIRREPLIKTVRSEGYCLRRSVKETEEAYS